MYSLPASLISFTAYPVQPGHAVWAAGVRVLNMPLEKYPNIMDKYRNLSRRTGCDYLMNHEYSLSPLRALQIPAESSPALSDLSRKLSM